MSKVLISKNSNPEFNIKDDKSFFSDLICTTEKPVSKLMKLLISLFTNSKVLEFNIFFSSSNFMDDSE